MVGECQNCGRWGTVEKHHIICGKGKRKQCETDESLVNLCIECHRGTKGVHGRDGAELNQKLRMGLQQRYFEMGYSEDKARELMGGKLYLEVTT